MTGQNLPPPQSPFVDTGSLNLSYDGYQYLLSLLNASDQSTASVSTGLKATGNNQATALLLTSQWNEVDTAVAGSGVLLASYQPGQSQVVVNESATVIAVYPPPGMQIDALGLNAAYSLGIGSRVTFDFFSAVQIRS